MRLEIVSHCWRYGGLLTYQMSSLVLHPPRSTSVGLTVVCAPREFDPGTWRVLDDFDRQTLPPTVMFQKRVLPPAQLFRRAIGRNLAAESTTADWLWFADCDMAFRAATFDRFSDAVRGTEGPL